MLYLAVPDKRSPSMRTAPVRRSNTSRKILFRDQNGPKSNTSKSGFGWLTNARTRLKWSKKFGDLSKWTTASTFMSGARPSWSSWSRRFSVSRDSSSSCSRETGSRPSSYYENPLRSRTARPTVSRRSAREPQGVSCRRSCRATDRLRLTLPDDLAAIEPHRTLAGPLHLGERLRHDRSCRPCGSRLRIMERRPQP